MTSHAEVPGRLAQLWEGAVKGRRYLRVVAESDGPLEEVRPPEPALPWLRLPLLDRQRFRVGPLWYSVWQPLTNAPPLPGVPLERQFLAHAGLEPGRLYRRGEDLLKAVVTAGDHILIDRLTYNFRRPKRGEIVVFLPRGVPDLPGDTYYIKRLVAIGGDRVRIGDDRHLVVNGVRLNAQTPHFGRLYASLGPPRDSVYSGHLNDAHGRRLHLPPGVLAPRFPNGRSEFSVRPHHCLVFGDNSVASYDGRCWGDFPQTQLLGRFWAVYWPFTERWGWSVE